MVPLQRGRATNPSTDLTDRTGVARSGLRVLVFQKLRGIWVARGLEHDLAVEGRSLESVMDLIRRLVLAHVAFDRRHGRAPLSPFGAAPQRFWRAFDRATRLPALKSSDGAAGSDLGPITFALSSEFPAEPMARSAFDRSLGRGSHAGLVARPGRPVH